LRGCFSQDCKKERDADPFKINLLSSGTVDAIYPCRSGQNQDKEGTAMKNSISKKTAYAGAGAGLVLFALFGLMPGSLMGGVAGINIAGWLFGLPLESGLLPRVIVLASMLAGVLVSGVGIVTATSTLGWMFGRALEAMVREKAPAKEIKTYATAEKRQ
jgi:hypothetical protein